MPKSKKSVSWREPARDPHLDEAMAVTLVFSDGVFKNVMLDVNVFLTPAQLVIVKYKDAMYNTPKIYMAVVVALYVYFFIFGGIISHLSMHSS